MKTNVHLFDLFERNSLTLIKTESKKLVRKIKHLTLSKHFALIVTQKRHIEGKQRYGSTHS